MALQPVTVTWDSLTRDQKLLVFRQRYVYRWQIPQIAAWWLDRAMGLSEYDLRQRLDQIPDVIAAEVRAAQARDTALTERLRTRTWRADRRSLETILGLLGESIVEAHERKDAKEVRASALAYQTIAACAAEMPDDRRRKRGVRSAVMEAATDEQVTAHWKDWCP